MNRRRILLALGLVVVGFGAGLLWYSSEPRYRGKPLSAWLEGIRNDDNWDARGALAALTNIGPRAIPFLLKEIQAEDDPLKEKVADWLNEHFDWQIKIPDSAFAQELATA